MDPIRKDYIRRFKTDRAIRSSFEELPRLVFSPNELEKLVETNRITWGLAPSSRVGNIIERLVKNEILSREVIIFGNEEKYIRYCYGNPTPFDLAVSLNPRAYLSHYSAVALLGLTTQAPKTIYTTVEESMRIGPTGGQPDQAAIDRAFALRQRRPEAAARIGEYNVVLLKGKYTNRAGVLSAEKVPYTSLERTLIDIAVRPAYSGGAFAILDAYRQAVAQGIAGNKITNWLEKFHYIYPYHQSIGFLLEKAGYEGPALAALRALPMEMDFYLDYEMKEKEYSPDWKLYYPTGM
ncbi:MAG TPA: hypothetical protein VN616_08915 [Puia sp.]|nr:hypothetical protein [Puia sp.]